VLHFLVGDFFLVTLLREDFELDPLLKQEKENITHKNPKQLAIFSRKKTMKKTKIRGHILMGTKHRKNLVQSPKRERISLITDIRDIILESDISCWKLDLFLLRVPPKWLCQGIFYQRIENLLIAHHTCDPIDMRKLLDQIPLYLRIEQSLLGKSRSRSEKFSEIRKDSPLEDQDFLLFKFILDTSPRCRSDSFSLNLEDILSYLPLHPLGTDRELSTKRLIFRDKILFCLPLFHVRE